METPWPCTLLLIILLTLISPSLSRDAVTVKSPLMYGDTLKSAGGNYTLGFFTPDGQSNNYSYVGIWYKDVKETILWVANRDSPMLDRTGVLSFRSNSANLELKTGSGTVVWSVNSSDLTAPVAQIRDTGNFVLAAAADINTSMPVWQSFDYPTDTLLPGMKFGWIAGQTQYLTSWKSLSNPSSGNYTATLSQPSLPEIILWDGTNPVFRTGPWNGKKFTGMPEIEDDEYFIFKYVSDQNETYIQMSDNPKAKLVVNRSSIEVHLLDDSGWIQQAHWKFPDEQCDDYNECGPHGICNFDNSNSPNCTCLDKFVPANDVEWKAGKTVAGCQRRVGLSHTTEDKFLSITDVKLPDKISITVDNTDESQCEKRCLIDSSCTAYTVNGTSLCVMWRGDLTDMRMIDHGSWTLHYRVAASEVPDQRSKSAEKKTVILVVVCVTLGLLIAASSAAYLIRKKLVNRNDTHGQVSGESPQPFSKSRKEVFEEDENIPNLPIFDANIILMATENFALSNKLGEGGFGTVFKGELEGGQKIAVKRLSYSSTQGLREFKNEVMLIAELQHINLVRLLGCCIAGDERMLVYEYMENTSLDYFIFDEAKSPQLDWQKRFEIIMGIARGILYLHQDSRLRIIHRDLKASNVLLDENMNPKISDFGIARIFGRHEKDSVTNQVVGTYGYMSPEYAMYGIFSVKSDVFSFGVLILEIISGKKVGEIFSTQPPLNLLSYAWTLWNDGKALELLNTSIPTSSRNELQIISCIEVGLSCVQYNPEDRPDMSEAILMLNSPNMITTKTKRPGYVVNKAYGNTESTSSSTLYATDTTAINPR